MEIKPQEIENMLVKSEKRQMMDEIGASLKVLADALAKAKAYFSFNTEIIFKVSETFFEEFQSKIKSDHYNSLSTEEQEVYNEFFSKLLDTGAPTLPIIQKTSKKGSIPHIVVKHQRSYDKRQKKLDANKLT